MTAKRKARNIEDMPGYLKARDATMMNVAARAAHYLGYTPRTNLHPSDLLTDPILARIAIAMPARDWHAADGVMRPKRWYDLRGHIRFYRAVKRAKGTIDSALERQADHDADAYHRR